MPSMMIDLPEPTSYWFITYTGRDNFLHSTIISRHPFQWEKDYTETYTLLSFKKLGKESIEMAKKLGMIE